MTERCDTMSEIENAVIRKIMERALVGENKYGATMERRDLSKLDWLIHAQEEAMDLCVYLERCIREEWKDASSDS